MEEAGFELRDVLMWLYGQGFPKSRNLTGRMRGWGTRYDPPTSRSCSPASPCAGTPRPTLARHGTGALHIDACRIPHTPDGRCPAEERERPHARLAARAGRWPANVTLSHAPSCTGGRCAHDCPLGLLGERQRFFYCAKASRRERDAGCERLPRRTCRPTRSAPTTSSCAEDNPVANIHPTVKPIELMRWLVRLLTPPGGLVLDPFAGSGSTGAAAVLEGARFVGIEREDEYVPIARARIAYWAGRPVHHSEGRRSGTQRPFASGREAER